MGGWGPLGFPRLWRQTCGVTRQGTRVPRWVVYLPKNQFFAMIKELLLLLLLLPTPHTVTYQLGVEGAKTKERKGGGSSEHCAPGTFNAGARWP